MSSEEGHLESHGGGPPLRIYLLETLSSNVIWLEFCSAAGQHCDEKACPEGGSQHWETYVTVVTIYI